MEAIKQLSTWFTANNPKLYFSQYGVEIDTGLSKLGDGTTLWNDLSYQAFPMEYATASGTNTYTTNFGKGKLLTYFESLRIEVKFTNANTTASTINVNGLGAKAIKKNVTSALTAGDIVAGGIYELIYDGTNFQIGNSVVSTSSIASFGFAQTEVDFGATPVADATFTIADANAIVGSKIIAITAYDAPTGKDLDEIEMDKLIIVAGNATLGNFQMFIQSADGSYLEGKFKINYKIF